LGADDSAVAARTEPGLLLTDGREALDRMLAIARASASEVVSSDRLH
jgi:hypothetical protein